MGEDELNNTPQPEQQKGGNAVDKTVEAAQKGKKVVDNVKKAKKVANAAKTLSMSGPLMYILFWVFVVIVAIIIITGIVMFLVTMPGMVMEKLKAIFKEIGNYIAAFYGADTTQQIDDVQIYETLDYLEDMGWDIKAEGFLTGYYKDGDSVESELSDSEKKAGYDIDEETGVVRGSEGTIILADSDFIFTYIMSDNYVYTLKNDNLATQNDADNWFEAIGAAIKSSWYKVKNFFYGPFFDALGVTDGMMDKYGKGLIGLYYDSSVGVKDKAVNKGSFWNWDTIEIDPESKKLSIKRRSFINNNNALEFSLDGWTGRYGMPLEFLLSVHKATMMPDLAYDMVTTFPTEIHLYLHDTSGTAVAGYKTTDGNYIKWSAIQEAIAGFEGRNWLTSWFADVSAWLKGDGARVEAAKQCGVNVGTGEEGVCSCTFKEGVGDKDGYQLEEHINVPGVDDNTWHYVADYSYTNENNETVEVHKKGDKYTGKRTTIKIVDGACTHCAETVDGIWKYMGDNTDYNYQAYTPYIAKVTDHWYRDVYFVVPTNSKLEFVDYDYEYEAVMKERWTLYETYTANESDKGTYKYNPSKAGEFIVYRINENGEYMKDSNGNYMIYDGTFDEARGETLYEKDSKGEYKMYTGVIDENTTVQLYRYMGDGVYEKYNPDTVIAVAKKAVTIDASDTAALKDQGWIKNSDSIWSAYKVEDTTSGFESLFNEEDIEQEPNETYKEVMKNCYINLDLNENIVQAGEGQRTETNTDIKKMFLQNKYFRYDGSEETAEIITALRKQDIDDKKDDIAYGALDENELKKTITIDGKEYKASDYAGVVTLNQDSLNAFSMLENTHTLDADYIYRDFKELIVELGYFEKEELTDETPRLLQFLIPDIGSGGYPNRTIDKRENEFGTMVHSKHDIDANKKYTLQELINQMGSEIPEDINKAQAEKANQVGVKGIRLSSNSINATEIGAIGDPSDGSRSVSQVSLDEFLETTREMCEYINKEGYDYCVLVGDEGDGKQNCHHAEVHGNSCSLPTTFAESQESVGKHNFCCATLVSWALQNVGVMPDAAHLDGANSLAQWIADNLNPEEISIGEPLKPGDILCYDGHIDLVGEEHNGGFVKYNGGHYTEANSVEFQGSSCIQHIDGWPNDSRLKFALRLHWGQSEAGNYEGYIGNEAVVSPVTGILLEYGTYDENSIDSVSQDEYRVNVDLKYGPSINLGNTESTEEAPEDPRVIQTPSQPADPAKTEETQKAETRKFSDKVGYAKILVLNKEVFEMMDSKVDHKWKNNNNGQGLLSTSGAFSDLITTEKQLKELTDDKTKDYLSETVYGYKEYAEMYEKYGIAGQIIYIDGFKCELPDEDFVDSDGDQDLSDETGNPDGKDLTFDTFKISASDIKAQKENELIVTKYEMPDEYKLASKKATEKLNVEETIKNDAYYSIVVDNMKTYKPLENLDKLVFIKEGTVLGRTYTNKELVEERLANGDDPKYNYEYYAPDKTTPVKEGEERNEDKLIGNYIRIIMRDQEDTVVENVEDYMKLDEQKNVECKFEHLAYFLGCLEEGFYDSMDLGDSYGVEVLKDGAGNTTAFGLTKAVAGLASVKSAYPNFGTHLAAGTVPKDEAQDVLILVMEAAKEEIQKKLTVPLEEDDPSLFALIDLHHASPSECYEVIKVYNSKSNNLSKEEMMAVFTEHWGSNENYGVQLRRRGRNRGWIASEGRWFLYQDGSEGDEVIFDSDEPWTEFCNASGTYEMTTESSGLYHVEKGADPDYINK